MGVPQYSQSPNAYPAMKFGSTSTASKRADPTANRVGALEKIA
jgi:hypothetical protein